MAWATKITNSAQVEYRLEESCGCDLDHAAKHAAGHEADDQAAADRQLEYRLKADLRWIGSGLGEVDLVAGQAVDKDAARALMDGRHPFEIDPETEKLRELVTPKQVVAPQARVAATPYVAAIQAAAKTAGIEPAAVFRHATAAARWARLERALQRDGERHTIPIGDLEQLAAAARTEVAGVEVPTPDQVYDKDVLAFARDHRDERVRVDQRGTDVVLDLPKSVSVLYALADANTAGVIEAEYMAAVTETITALEGWAAYGVTGHHGDGQTAARVESSGWIGWTMLHRSARPTATPDGGMRVGDPHLHAHAVLAHMVRCEDGKWRAPGSGGRDIYRHVAASGELAKARVRARLSERLGVRWEQDENTGAWEVAGIPRELREEFSARSRQILEKVSGPDASAAEQRTVAAQLAKSRPDVEPTDVRAQWRAAADRVVPDVDAMLADVMPGPPGPGGPSVPGPGRGPDGPVLGPSGSSPQVSPSAGEALPVRPVAVPAAEQIAARVWTGETSLTAYTKTVTRVQVLTAVAASCPGGVADVAQLEALTDAVIAAGPTIAVPAAHASHHTNTRQWTTRDIVEAEHTITTAAAAQLDVGAAAVADVVAEATVTAWAAERGLTLSGEQADVVHRLTTAGHGIDAVIGVAGAGKTTLMAAARTVWEDSGYTVAGASTAAVASAGLAAEAGIPSRTIASWLDEIDDPARPGLRDIDVLVIDEAAMVDDRALARLVRAAEPSPANPEGTKLVAIGDHLQSRAIGVGGAFRAVHEIVIGAELRENRRQRDPVEREALQAWREGARRTALDQLAGHGRIHAVELPEQVHTEMLTAWDVARARYAGDPHAQLSGMAMLATRNADVEALNAGARALRIAAGELPPDDSATLYRRAAAAGGGTIALAPGDLVRVRQNDYRSRHDPNSPDVLNGYRAVVTDVDADRQVRIEWRRPDPHAPGGHRTEAAWITPAQIADGHLSHGYAMTIAAAQGMTCDLALGSGVGADAHTLYPALTRARESTHLWLARTAVEDDTTSAVLGPATDHDRLARTIAAYADQLERDRPDSLISELLAHDHTAAHVRDVLTEARRQAEARRQVDEQPGDPGDAETGPDVAPGRERTPEPVPEPDRVPEPALQVPAPATAPEQPARPNAAAVAAQSFAGPLEQADVFAQARQAADRQAQQEAEREAQREAARRAEQVAAEATRAALGQQRAAEIIADRAWPDLAREIHRADQAGLDAPETLARADRYRLQRDGESQAQSLHRRTRDVVDLHEYRTGQDTEGARRGAAAARDAQQTVQRMAQQHREREQADARLARERQQVEAELARVQPWSERPYGRVPDKALPQRIAAAEQRAADNRAQADALRQRLEAGPTKDERLARARQQLEAADIAEHGAAIQERRAQQITNQLYAKQAEQYADQSRLKTERAATGRLFGDLWGRHDRAAQDLQVRVDERAQEIQEMTEQSERATEQARELREAAGKTRTDVGATYRWESTSTTLDTLANRYSAEERQTRYNIDLHTREATKADKAAAGLRTEAAVRDGLSPDARQVEDIDRRHTTAREAAAEAKAEAERAAQYAREASYRRSHDHYRGPSQSGPSLGL